MNVLVIRYTATCAEAGAQPRVIAIANIIVFLNPHHSLIFATIVIITIFIDIIINNIHNITRRLKIDFSTCSSFDEVGNVQVMINSK